MRRVPAGSSKRKSKKTLPFQVGYRGRDLHSGPARLWLCVTHNNNTSASHKSDTEHLRINGPCNRGSIIGGFQVVLPLFSQLPHPTSYLLVYWYYWQTLKSIILNYVEHMTACVEATYVQLQTYFFLTCLVFLLGFIWR